MVYIKQLFLPPLVMPQLEEKLHVNHVFLVGFMLTWHLQLIMMDLYEHEILYPNQKI